MSIRPQSKFRGMHSRESSNIDELLPVHEDEGLGDANDNLGATRGKSVVHPVHANPSPGTSSASSLFRRLTTKIASPISPSRFTSLKRSQGRRYDTLGETGYDPVPVDLSSLDGLGFELRDMSTNQTQPLADQDTSYTSAYGRQEKPRFQDFVTKRRTIGDGLVIGAELTRALSQVPTRASSSRSGTGSNSAIQRMKTVRDIGQSLAQEKNIIVAVEEAVDISSLEGSSLQHRSSQNVDGLMQRTGTASHETHQSYFFPEDPDIPNWRPFSMRSIYILSLTGLALGLAIFQEYLYRHSVKLAEQNSGLLEFNAVAEISVWDFFAWKYLPTMITIIYAVLFSIMDFDIRRLEPYYQLSQPYGAPASSSLNLDHLTMFQYFVPFKAFRLGQWAVFWSTIGNILAATAAPAIQNPSISFIANPACGNSASGCPDGQKLYWVRVSNIWSRLLTASYAVIAVIAMTLFIQLRRRSGLLSDPKGIAGIASMATKSHILHDFNGMDEATRGQIHRRLQHRRFVLYKSSIWQGEWNSDSEPIHESARRLRSPHPFMLRLSGGIPFMLFMVFMLAGVPLISITPARIVPNTVAWLPVLLATLLKLFFTTFESDVRLMEPFYQLSRGNAPPQHSLTLDYQATVYGWMPFKALFNGHFLVALVGFSSVALDILTVTVSSFSVDSQIFLTHTDQDVSNQDETFASFWASFSLSIIILTGVLCTTALVYHRRRHPFLPREPSTIAAVLAFIYASNMLKDFIDTETLTSKQMEAKLKGLNKTYGLGWFRGRDGQNHCAIDEEPMKSRYVHGKPYTQSQAGPVDPHDPFYGA